MKLAIAGCGRIASVHLEAIKQLTQKVEWLQIIQSMNQDGYNKFIEVGPNKVLTNLNKQILPTSTTINAESIKGILD